MQSAHSEEYTIRSYGAAVSEVCLYIGGDEEIVALVATESDRMQFWENTDLWTLEHLGCPPDGAMVTSCFELEMFQKDFAMEAYLHEIHSRQTLGSLSGMYKRLRAGAEIPEIIFRIIILKMLWVSSDKEYLAGSA